MATDVKVPSLGDSVTEAVLIKWHKKDGEFVNRDEPIAELETDKANTDISSPASGVFKGAVAQGTTIKVGQTIGTIDEKASAPSKSTSSTPTASEKSESKSKSDKPTRSVALDDLSPATRRAVQDAGVDPSKITATGPGGRLTKEDVEKYVQANKTPFSTETVRPEVSVGKPIEATIKSSDPVVSSPVSASTSSVPASPGTRRQPMSKIRKRIAENLVKAKQQTAMLTTFNEVDMSAIMKLRGTYKESFEKKHGIGLGFMSFFVRACCVALREFERVNGQIDGDDFVLFDHVHMGVAVSTDRGLTVPVLKNADRMSFAQIESEIKRVAIAARDGKLGLDELSGGTFTITNGGIFGSLNSTPIINPPQSAILGMHAIKDRPVVVDGKIEIRPMMNLALSYDHRIIDGRESVSFLVKVKALLEDPMRLMLDV